MSITANFPKSRRFYGLLAGNVVVLSLIGVFVLRPVLGLLVKHTNEIVRTRSDVAFIQGRTADLRKLKEAYPTYEATYGPLLSAIPKTKDVAGYQTELEDLAKLTSNNLLTVDTSGNSSAGKGGTSSAPSTSAGPAPTAGGFPTIPVKIDMTGTFASTLDFMHRLETMDRFTKVTAMDIKSVDTSGAVKVSLQLQTLYFGGNPK